MDEADYTDASVVSRLVFDQDGRMLLCCAQNIQEDEIFCGRQYMVQNLEYGLIVADRTMVKQILRSLIDNSVKYTQVGGSIDLRCDSADGLVRLSVSDTGVGMDAEHASHIFERFYRVGKARARATGGMWLGLSIVAAIAKRTAAASEQ